MVLEQALEIMRLYAVDQDQLMISQQWNTWFVT
jgi:hypothetical protein